MVTLREGMVQLNIPITEELRDELDTEVVRRCGYPKRGILGEVVIEALREYFDKRHTQTHFQTNLQEKKVEALPKLPLPKSRFNRKYELLKTNIKTYGAENNYKIGHAKLKDLIKDSTGGMDHRTIEKYIELLAEDFIISPETDGTYSTSRPKPIIRSETQQK